MAGSLSRAWRHLVEGPLAHGLANRFGVPSGRREQLRLDMQRAWLAVQLWQLNQRNQPASLKTYQRLLLQSQVVNQKETFPLVADHIRHQILGIAGVLHHALEQAGDATPAARVMLRAQAALTGHVEQQADCSTGKVHLSQHQVSELMRSRWGHALQVRPSTVDHPDAGLGLFVQGSVPAGGVVAILPGVVYARTQLPRMPNFPKVAQDNPFLSSTIEMSVIDGKPWGLGARTLLSPCLHAGIMSGSDHSHGRVFQEGGGGACSPRTPSSILQAALPGSGAQPTYPPPPSQPLSISSSSNSSRGSSPAPAVYPSATASQPPLLGYTCAYTPGEDGSMVHASGCGAWALAALEERHPLAWGHMANHPGPGMQPNVLEVPFALDLGPSAACLGHTALAAGRQDPRAGLAGRAGALHASTHTRMAEGASGNEDAAGCWLRAYVPCAPFLEPPPYEDLMREGLAHAAAQALLQACGWPRAPHLETKDSGARLGNAGEEKAEEEEQDLCFRLPSWLARGSSGSIKSKRGGGASQAAQVHGLVLLATQALQDGDEVLLNYRLSPHSPRPPWYHSIDPQAEARRWAQLPLKGLLS